MFALRLYYFASYAGIGAVMPLLALALSARGFRPSQYAWLMALTPLSRMLAPPLWGVLADRWFGTVKLIRINTAVAALSMLVLAGSHDLRLITCAFAVWAFASSSLVPLADAGAYRMLAGSSSSFAYVRVFGSIGFAVCALGLSVVGVDAALRLPFMVAAGTYVSASLIAGRLHEGAGPTRAPLVGAFRLLLRRPDVLLLWLGSVFYYLGHGAFDAYFGPYARTIEGVEPSTISSAWALGVGCEVLLMWWVPRFLRGRLRRSLLIGAATTAALRWWLLARASTALDVWLQQPLHAITYGLWYLAFVHENQSSVDDSIRATVQGVAVACMGLGMIVATLAGGYVFESYGGRTLFQLATGAALLALLCYAARQWLLARRQAAAHNALASTVTET
ncbi:MAG: putative 3-phenylpropionic acid transporter [Myxococcaceae bacterium]|nr:putative 3-phenylpropionic acid transporter [Myxococcaceae bacterium]